MDREEIIQFGQWVRSQRKGRGMTQAQLAEAVGVASITISTLETGTVRSLGKKTEHALEVYFSNEKAETAENPDGTEARALAERIARLVCAPDFSVKVAQLQDILKCNALRAATVIIEEAISTK